MEKVQAWDNYWLETKDGLGLVDHEGVMSYLSEQCAAEELVVDIGCGVGRLARFFAGNYVGVDISSECVRRARARYPDRDFRLMELGEDFPKGTCSVLSNVLLHHNDEDARTLVGRIHSPRILIAETPWEEQYERITQGVIPVFNRTQSEITSFFPGHRVGAIREFPWLKKRGPRAVRVVEFLKG